MSLLKPIRSHKKYFTSTGNYLMRLLRGPISVLQLLLRVLDDVTPTWLESMRDFLLCYMMKPGSDLQIAVDIVKRRRNPKDMFHFSLHAIRDQGPPCRFREQSQNRNPAVNRMMLYIIIAITMPRKILNGSIFLDPMAVPVHGQLRERRRRRPPIGGPRMWDGGKCVSVISGL
jgi:hypothetical protein